MRGGIKLAPKDKDKLKKFCPKCGSEGDVFIRGFCEKCYFQDNEIVAVPEKIRLERCRRCDKVKFQGKWTDPKISDLIASISKKVKVKEIENPQVLGEIVFHSTKETAAHFKISGKIDGTDVEFEKNITLEFKSCICDPCMRVTSNYHESIVQVRSSKKITKTKMHVILRDINLLLSKERKKDPLAEVVAVKTSKTGFDVLIGSKSAGKRSAERLARKYNSTIKTSYKIVGRDTKKGKEKKRFTFCVRV